MAEAKSTGVAGRDTLPKLGRVNEVCREWLIREDGALAYRLQNEEITEHYTGNKYRNAQVREDFPCALDEQIREQRLAEQAAALYHQMITEQEEQDAYVAKQLADKIEKEELAKKRAIEEEDEEIARQLLERERLKQLERQRVLLQQQHLQQSSQTIEPVPLNQSPQRVHELSPRKLEYHDSPKRQGYLMPLPAQSPTNQNPILPSNHISTPSTSSATHIRSNSDDLLDPFQQCSIADALELGLPVDEIDERRMQEKRDAELARKLQEQESCSAEEIQQNRDRLMAIEAQDKELAKLLQERERAKVRRAKERAKQKALAKKQQTDLNPDQILPDDSYSNPIDLLQHPECSHSNPQANYRIPAHDIVHHHEDDANYSYPVDILPPKASTTAGYDHNLKQNYSPQKNYDSRLTGYNHKAEIRALNGSYPPGGASSQAVVGTTGLPLLVREHVPAVRPTQLDIKAPITKSVVKPRSPDPDSIEICEPGQSDFSPHMNIAMAIDPTYTRRSISQTPSSQDTSTVSTISTTSSTTSPAISLPPPDLSEDELSPVPPYMPIQGQRRTASLEKKQKKRAKDGCKQQ